MQAVTGGDSIRQESAFREGYPNETSMVFLDDDTCYCLLRRDGGSSTAQLGVAKPLYTEWSWKDLGVRIGGPQMIRLADGRFVAAVRLYDGKVRTALCCWIRKKERLPSSRSSGGDNELCGLAWHEGLLWVSTIRDS